MKRYKAVILGVTLIATVAFAHGGEDHGAPPPSADAHGGAGATAPGADPAPELKEAQMFLSDYKVENGVSFPRAITIKVQDGPTEEWTVQKVKINPAFGADHFKKR